MKKLINTFLGYYGLVLSRRATVSKMPFLNSLEETMLSGTQIGNCAASRGVVFNEIKSQEEYMQYVKNVRDVYSRRKMIESLMALPSELFFFAAYNALIDQVVSYRVDYQFSNTKDEHNRLPNYRESVLCTKTHTNSRMRAAVMALFNEVGGKDKLKQKNIYMTEMVTPLYTYFQRICPNVVGSEYLGESIEKGKTVNGVRHEDITGLSFEDNSFDVIVSLEVLEHVPAYKSAYSEIFRCLKPMGTLILSVPFNVDVYENILRATVDSSGKIENILPAEYHGDPVNPEGGILCYQHFGWVLLDELRGAGFKKVKSLFTWSLYHGILGTDIMVICATK